MRAFIVLALVAVASADVKHLYDAPYNKPATGASNGYGVGNTGSSYQPTSSNLNNNYAQPSGSGFVQQQPIGSGKFGGDSVGALPQGTNGNSGFSAPANTGFSSTGNNGFTGPASNGFAAPTTGFSGSAPAGFSGSITGFPGNANTGFTAPSNNGFSGSANNGFVAPANNGFSGSANNGFVAPSNNGFSAPSTAGFGNSGSTNSNYKATVVKQTDAIVSKSSYVYSAPDDSEDIQREQTIVLPRPRQHYKVVFIKAPSTTIINTPSTGTGGHAQEKTLIYVLSDKKRIENHIDVPDTDANKVQKPEVFFVKYNKPTEVVNSQIKYETVDQVNGAENGAVNGVPNKVRGNGQLQDEPATPEQAEIAQAIHQALQNGGLDSALSKVNELIKGGHSITAGNDLPVAGGNGGLFDQQSSNSLPTGAIPTPVSSGSGNSGISGARYPEQGYVY